MKAAEEKVPGGKLVRVTVTPGGLVEITGDFFAHPEEGITLIERALGSMKGTESTAEIELTLRDIVTGSGIELIGLDVPAIVRLYSQARSSVHDVQDQQDKHGYGENRAEGQ